MFLSPKINNFLHTTNFRLSLFSSGWNLIHSSEESFGGVWGWVRFLSSFSIFCQNSRRNEWCKHWSLGEQRFLKRRTFGSHIFLSWRKKYFRHITDILSQYKQPFYLHTWSNIQLISKQCWYKIQQSDDENNSINQHEGVILIWHQILSNNLQKFMADGGETYESHLSSQRVITMNYSSESEFEPNYD